MLPACAQKNVPTLAYYRLISILQADSSALPRIYRPLDADIVLADVAASALPQTAFHLVLDGRVYLVVANPSLFRFSITYLIMIGGPHVIATELSGTGSLSITAAGTKPQ